MGKKKLKKYKDKSIPFLELPKPKTKKEIKAWKRRYWEYVDMCHPKIIENGVIVPYSDESEGELGIEEINEDNENAQWIKEIEKKGGGIL